MKKCTKILNVKFGRTNRLFYIGWSDGEIAVEASTLTMQGWTPAVPVPACWAVWAARRSAATVRVFAGAREAEHLLRWAGRAGDRIALSASMDAEARLMGLRWDRESQHWVPGVSHRHPLGVSTISPWRS